MTVTGPANAAEPYRKANQIMSALRGSTGQGMAAKTQMDLTRSPSFPHSDGPGADGEYPGTGARYTADLNERSNKSNPRNQGPDRAGSHVANSPLTVASMGMRHTGRVG